MDVDPNQDVVRFDIIFTATGTLWLAMDGTPVKEATSIEELTAMIVGLIAKHVPEPGPLQQMQEPGQEQSQDLPAPPTNVG